jgi:uncharacterized protein involved in response to NO
LTSIHPRKLALWDLGFRPFFLGAISAAPLLMLAWIGAYTGVLDVGGPFAFSAWHAHEMIFGYAAAVIAGFLLTAAFNWANLPTATGGGLALLVLLWLAGRIAPLAGNILPRWLPAVLDVSFLPAVAVLVAVPLIQARQWQNLIFVPILLALAVLNACAHLNALGHLPDAGHWPFRLAVYVIILLIVLIGGRVIPFFTERALPGVHLWRWPILDGLSIATLIALAIADLLDEQRMVVATAGLAALVHAARWMGWWARDVWKRPMLWVLYLGYVWLIVGFGLIACAGAGLASKSLAAHAWTTGAIGTMTLGMMVRVTLGHTGRAVIHAPGPAGWAFALVNLAAVARVLGPLAAPAHYVDLVVVSSVLWIAAFVLVLAVCGPMLLTPRAE